MAYRFKKRRETALNREEAVRMLSDVAEKMYGRLSADRFIVKKTDADYLAMVRAWGNVMTALNTILRDDQITELQKLIEEREGELSNDKS